MPCNCLSDSTVNALIPPLLSLDTQQTQALLVYLLAKLANVSSQNINPGYLLKQACTCNLRSDEDNARYQAAVFAYRANADGKVQATNRSQMETLIKASRCLRSLNERELAAVQTYLLCSWLPTA
jgi:hypothetical protein